MPDFNVRSDSVNVEQIMERIRARIAEKRGVDYTEEQIRELATVKLERFLDPKGVRSDLLEQFRRTQAKETQELPAYTFEEDTLFESTRPLLRWVRRLLRPLLKLFINPNRLIQVLHVQSRLNAMLTERETRRRETDHLRFEVLHNLVVETTRLGIEVKNLTMRVESLSSRLDFNERRARALERVVVYRPSPDEAPAAAVASTSAVPPASVESPAAAGPVGPPVRGAAAPTEGPGQRSRRRRRRRGRRGGAPASALLGGAAPGAGSPDDAAALPEGTSESFHEARTADSPPAVEPEPDLQGGAGPDGDEGPDGER
jgi:hypothetical protein